MLGVTERRNLFQFKGNMWYVSNNRLWCTQKLQDKEWQNQNPQGILANTWRKRSFSKKSQHNLLMTRVTCQSSDKILDLNFRYYIFTFIILTNHDTPANAHFQKMLFHNLFSRIQFFENRFMQSCTYGVLKDLRFNSDRREKCRY